MERVLLLEKTPFQLRAALIEDGRVNALDSFFEDDENVGGSLYLARVENVIKGMQACFAYIGDDKNAYLYYADIPGSSPEKSISELVKQGDELIVQVVKEKSGNKGARITANIRLPFSHFILTPFDPSVGVSHKIADEEMKNKLRVLAAQCLGKDCGCIFRTSAADADLEELTGELTAAKEEYAALKNRAAIARPGTLLSRKRSQWEEACARFPADRWIVNEEDGLLQIRESYPGADVRLEREGLYEKYGAEEALEEACSRRVWLKSGGYLIIDYTEAMTVVDVNSGRFTGKKSIEETALSINREAAAEAARQLRLRNIGGIIVIDFIDMKKEDSRRAVIAALAEAMETDTAAHTIVGMTKLGLVELTRKKIGKSLREVMLSPCGECEGGNVASNLMICENVRRALHRAVFSNSVSAVLLTLNDQIAELIAGSDGLRDELHTAYPDRSFYVAGDRSFSKENYVFTYAKSAEDIAGYKRMGKLL